MLLADAGHLAHELLTREGWLLDRRDWAAWLALYAEDATYRVPAWRDESEETQDPQTEVSLIYHTRRVELEERVFRIRSRQSVTALPLPRTTHFVSNLCVTRATAESIEARASFMVQFYEPRTTTQRVHFGSYAVALAPGTESWVITRKTIHLQNDCVAAVLDFYLL